MLLTTIITTGDRGNQWVRNKYKPINRRKKSKTCHMLKLLAWKIRKILQTFTFQIGLKMALFKMMNRRMTTSKKFKMTLLLETMKRKMIQRKNLKQMMMEKDLLSNLMNLLKLSKLSKNVMMSFRKKRMWTPLNLGRRRKERTLSRRILRLKTKRSLKEASLLKSRTRRENLF